MKLYQLVINPGNHIAVAYTGSKGVSFKEFKFMNEALAFCKKLREKGFERSTGVTQ